MKYTLARLLLVAIALVSLPMVTSAQFYPEARAYWRGWDDNGGPPGFNVGLAMPIFPDTLINGTTYKKIRENNDALGSPEFIRDHFVRSDTDGKGYVYIPDSAAEFLTGDLGVQAGDTVHDVLVSLTNSTDIAYFFRDLIIDSVVTLSINGTSAMRWYINGDDAGGLLLFWQTGMGTISGPMLEMSGQWWYCCVNDTVRYGSGPCPSWITDVSEPENSPELSLLCGPNPSSGSFLLSDEFHPEQVQVFNPQGQEIIRSRERLIDLSAYAPGLYTVVVETDDARFVERVVIE
jgi:hypothetical protein